MDCRVGVSGTADVHPRFVRSVGGLLPVHTGKIRYSCRLLRRLLPQIQEKLTATGDGTARRRNLGGDGFGGAGKTCRKAQGLQGFLRLLPGHSGIIFDHHFPGGLLGEHRLFHTQVGKDVIKDGAHRGSRHDAAGNIDSRGPGGGVQGRQNNILRVLHGGDPHKGHDLILDPLAVFIKHIDLLAGAGLSADRIAGYVGIFRGTLRDHGTNELPHGPGGGFLNGPADHRGLLPQNRVPVGAEHLRDDIGLHQIPPVYHRGNGPDQLQRRQLKGLAEGTGGQGGRAPLVRIRHQSLVKENTLALTGKVNAGFFQHAKPLHIFIEPLPAQLQGNMGKGNIAGILQRLGCLLRPMAGGTPAVKPLGAPGDLLGAPAVKIGI